MSERMVDERRILHGNISYEVREFVDMFNSIMSSKNIEEFVEMSDEIEEAFKQVLLVKYEQLQCKGVTEEIYYG